jgi:hypothetical protein
MNAEMWKYVLIAIGVIALGYTLFDVATHERMPQAPKFVLMIDAPTGNVYEVRLRGRPRSLPMEHPETGERTLFPAEPTEDGGFQVRTRYVGEQFREVASSDLVDLETGRLLKNGVEPERKSDW